MRLALGGESQDSPLFRGRQADSGPLGFGRSVAGDLAAGERREWLVTNGLGGFASGTVAGVATRRYHGLLVAALHPPVGRRFLVASLDATARYRDRTYELFTNRWADGTTGPAGYRYVERFELEATVPLWRYALADALLEKRIWMEPGVNCSYVRYRLARASAAVTLEVVAFVNDRDFHAVTSAGAWRMQVDGIASGIRVTAFEGAVPFVVCADRGSAHAEHEWYRNHLYAEEERRGLDACDDRLRAATFTVVLSPDEEVTFALALDPAPADMGGALIRRRDHEHGILERWRTAFPEVAARAPAWTRQLVLAADQFDVARPSAGDGASRSIVAGYPWFGDWGRDTMIALPGILIATGNATSARRVLETFARFVADGLIPNYFPDAGSEPEYNSVDAALWFVEAVRLTLEATGDLTFLRRVFPAVGAIVAAYRHGTRFAIHEDPADGLVAAGEAGVALTWMDARVAERAITPRIGKPVEVNALWLRAQMSLAEFARSLDEPVIARDAAAGAERTRAGFARFWNAERSYLYDVLDGPDGNDATLRPNQLFAVSLPISALSSAQQRSVVESCTFELLTTLGLRSLNPRDARYRGHYGGTAAERDAAYHEGTVWGWLTGVLATATWRAYGDREQALEYLEALGREIDAYGLGTLPEIADGDPPHAPRGAIAQAWTVGEVLRAWMELAG